MARFLHHLFSLDPRKVRLWFLALAFAAGLAAGVVLCTSANAVSYSWMRSAADSPVSIVKLLGVILLPFLFSAAAVYLDRSWFLIPIAFCKALSFSYVACAISRAYGGAGWLMQPLLMFADAAFLPVLVFFWIGYGFGGRKMSCRTVFLFFCIAVAVGYFDHCLISPILVVL